MYGSPDGHGQHRAAQVYRDRCMHEDDVQQKNDGLHHNSPAAVYNAGWTGECMM